MKINRTINIIGIAFFVSLIFASGVSAQKIRYNSMPGIDFSRYKSYQWVRIEKAQYPNQLLDQQITDSIDALLRQKGLTKTSEGIPDLVFAYQVAVDKETQWNTYGTGGGYWGWGGWGGWGGMGSTTTYSNTINVGSLNLDVYDVATKKQIWRGVATKTLDPPKDPAKLRGRIDKAMAKLLKNYPPPRPKN